MPNVTPKLNPKTKQTESFDSLLRRFKRACDKAEIVQEIRQRQYHEKPNDTKNQKNQDLKRQKKLNAKRALQNPIRKRR
jgi:small subunit ribosomal protein S21|tara:strand:+ start:200 stop:436 length:237 start_codon:yes stop_codon:yes gene_type:complete